MDPDDAGKQTFFMATLYFGQEVGGKGVCVPFPHSFWKYIRLPPSLPFQKKSLSSPLINLNHVL